MYLWLTVFQYTDFFLYIESFREQGLLYLHLFRWLRIDFLHTFSLIQQVSSKQTYWYSTPLFSSFEIFYDHKIAWTLIYNWSMSKVSIQNLVYFNYKIVHEFQSLCYSLTCSCTCNPIYPSLTYKQNSHTIIFPVNNVAPSRFWSICPGIISRTLSNPEIP